KKRDISRVVPEPRTIGHVDDRRKRCACGTPLWSSPMVTELPACHAVVRIRGARQALRQANDDRRNPTSCGYAGLAGSLNRLEIHLLEVGTYGAHVGTTREEHR